MYVDWLQFWFEFYKVFYKSIYHQIIVYIYNLDLFKLLSGVIYVVVLCLHTYTVG